MGSLSLVKSNDEEADVFCKGRTIVSWEITDYKLHNEAPCLGAKAQNAKNTCILFLKWDAVRVLHQEEEKVSKEAMPGILTEHPGVWNGSSETEEPANLDVKGMADEWIGERKSFEEERDIQREL